MLKPVPPPRSYRPKTCFEGVFAFYGIAKGGEKTNLLPSPRTTSKTVGEGEKVKYAPEFAKIAFLLSHMLITVKCECSEAILYQVHLRKRLYCINKRKRYHIDRGASTG